MNHLAAPAAILLVRAAPPGRRWIGPAGILASAVSGLVGDGWTRLPAPASGWHQFHYAG